MATVPMEKSGEVSAAYATDPSVTLKKGHSIAAMKTKKDSKENEIFFFKKQLNSKAQINKITYVRRWGHFHSIHQ